MEIHKNEAPIGVFGADLDSPDLPKRITRKELKKSPPIEIVPEEKVFWHFFKKCDDEQVKASVRFAEDWARLMQLYIQNGYTVTDCWLITANSTPNENIDEITAHRTLRLLSIIWQYGQELHEAYNTYYEKVGKAQKLAELDELLWHLD